MNFDTFGIPFAFILLGVMALWLIIGARGHWLLKMLFISLSLYFGLAMWSSVDNLLGWPTNKELPEKFRIYWIEIKEPNKITGNPGAIYLFVKEMKTKKQEEEPKSQGWLIQLYPAERDDYRLHQVPYSLEMHKNAQQLQKGIRGGGKFYGTNGKGKGGKGKGGKGKGGKGKGQGDGPNVPGKKGEGEGSGSFDFSQEQGIMFYELPPPKLPEKLYE